MKSTSGNITASGTPGRPYARADVQTLAVTLNTQGKGKRVGDMSIPDPVHLVRTDTTGSDSFAGKPVVIASESGELGLVKRPAHVLRCLRSAFTKQVDPHV